MKTRLKLKRINVQCLKSYYTTTKFKFYVNCSKLKVLVITKFFFFYVSVMVNPPGSLTEIIFSCLNGTVAVIHQFSNSLFYKKEKIKAVNT